MGGIGRAECNDCPMGKYSIVPWNPKKEFNGLACVTCPNGYRNTKPGESFCVPCAGGKYGATCTDCAKGQYRSSSDDAATCKQCIAGEYQPEIGQTACLPCIPVRDYFLFFFFENSSVFY